MAERLAGKVALITGGTSGIGEATVELFVAEGAKVLFTGRNHEKGGAQASALGENVAFRQADVRREADMAGSVAEAIERWGRLDVLFNNAGGPSRGEVDTFTESDFRDAMDLLLFSVLTGIKHAAPAMKEQRRGAIINNASVAGQRTHMGGYLYSIAKAAVIHATRLAGMALGPWGVTVNAISPGGVATPIFLGGAAGVEQAQLEAKLAKLRGNLAKATPLRRSGLPADIARGALFLASDEGAFVNCHDLVIDAGMTAGGRTNYEDMRAGSPT
ncbi:MAG: SDR family NAD(P)-dependent oxidoreductase [Caulobacteraceae bacterium]